MKLAQAAAYSRAGVQLTGKKQILSLVTPISFFNDNHLNFLNVLDEHHSDGPFL